MHPTDQVGASKEADDDDDDESLTTRRPADRPKGKEIESRRARKLLGLANGRGKVRAASALVVA